MFIWFSVRNKQNFTPAEVFLIFVVVSSQYGRAIKLMTPFSKMWTTLDLITVWEVGIEMSINTLEKQGFLGKFLLNFKIICIGKIKMC